MFGKSLPPVSTDEKKIEEITSRGVEEIIPSAESLKKLLRSGKRLRIKLGIDPTSPHLHLGRSVPLLKLRDFQELGHKVVFIIGDATGVVGDTSDKDAERPMLTEAQVKENLATYVSQVTKILDKNLLEVRRNSGWLLKLNYRDIGEHADRFSVSDFIARDNIKKRLDGGKRVSLREVLYPLMQGYDSVAIEADVELGGTDQRFNLLAGRALQEKYKQAPQHIVMTELILDMYSIKFKEAGFDVVTSLDAEAALGQLESVKPDVMLLDVVMPHMSGLELLERLKTLNLTRPVIIILSNQGQQSDIDKAKALGVDGYIIKASTIPSEVLDKVLEIMEAKK
jgi:tyrosyl-tRNA synthetase